MVLGTIDSKHAFALFLNNLHVPFSETSGDDVRAALVKTIKQLSEWTGEAGIHEASFYNFAVTDGRSIVVSRYCSAEGIGGASLYYSRGLGFECSHEGVCDMSAVGPDEEASAVIVASERLTDYDEDWVRAPDNHTVTVLQDGSVKVDRIRL